MNGLNYLKQLVRYGLDARVLQDYKAYGQIYISHRNHNYTADLSKFVDYEGVDKTLIALARNLEANMNIEIFHIVWNENKELSFMYHSNSYDEKSQLTEFKKGMCNAIKYNFKTHKYRYCPLNYEVSFGAIVDKDYMPSQDLFVINNNM